MSDLSVYLHRLCSYVVSTNFFLRKIFSPLAKNALHSPTSKMWKKVVQEQGMEQ